MALEGAAIGPQARNCGAVYRWLPRWIFFLECACKFAIIGSRGVPGGSAYDGPSRRAQAQPLGRYCLRTDRSHVDHSPILRGSEAALVPDPPCVAFCGGPGSLSDRA